MLIHEFSSGDRVLLQEDTLVLHFAGTRRTVSTSVFNGGCREDLRAVFNHHLPPDKCTPDALPGGSVQNYFAHLSAGLNLPCDRTSGMLTAAKMENAVIRTATFRRLEVTAVVTAGVDINGGRAGDPAFYYEEDGRWEYLAGTINIILYINANLPAHTLVRAIVTATEAKAAALAEVMAPSRYSSGIATGSGTDQIIAVANSQSPYLFTDAGKHSKLGELIGVTVKQGVRLALEKETGLNPKRQCSVLARLERFGITAEDFWQAAQKDGIKVLREPYLRKLEQLDRDENLVALTAGLLHLLDEYQWGLLSGAALMTIGTRFVEASLGKVRMTEECADNPVSFLLKLFVRAVNTWVCK